MHSLFLPGLPPKGSQSDIILSWKTLNDPKPHGFHRVKFLPLHVCQPCVCVSCSVCLTLCDPMDYSLPGFSVPWKSPGQNIRVGNHSFLQRIFPTQESTWMSCIADRLFTVWASREALVPSLIIHFSQDTCDLRWEMVLESHFMMPAEAYLFLEPVSRAGKSFTISLSSDFQNVSSQSPRPRGTSLGRRQEGVGRVKVPDFNQVTCSIALWDKDYYTRLKSWGTQIRWLRSECNSTTYCLWD